MRNYRFLWLTRQSRTNKSIQSKWKQIESIKAKLLGEKNQTQCNPQKHGRRQLMTVGAERCWLIKPGWPCAWRQGQQSDQSGPAQTSLLSCSPAGSQPSTCSHWRLKQGCVSFPKNIRKAKLENMSFPVASSVPAAPPTYLRPPPVGMASSRVPQRTFRSVWASERGSPGQQWVISTN